MAVAFALKQFVSRNDLGFGHADGARLCHRAEAAHLNNVVVAREMPGVTGWRRPCT